MSCFGCKGTRAWSRSCGSNWLHAATRQCYPCWLRRRASLHIAGRIALAVVVTIAAVLALGLAWRWAGRMWL
jgi:hypothetical protein